MCHHTRFRRCWDGAQGFLNPGQALCQLSHTPALFFLFRSAEDRTWKAIRALPLNYTPFRGYRLTNDTLLAQLSPQTAHPHGS